VILSAILAIFPGMVADLEKRSTFWRVGVPLIVIAIGVSGFLRGLVQKHVFQSQIGSLTTGVQIEATKDDIKTLTTHIDDGFSKVIDSINRLAVKESTIPKKTVPSQPSKSTVQLPPPVVEHLQFAQRRVPSTKPDSPYGLQVVIQTDVPIEGAGLEIDFDGEIDENSSFFVAGVSAMMSVRSGLTQDRKGFILGFGYPTWTPDHPIVVTALSKQSVQVTAIKQIHF